MWYVYIYIHVSCMFLFCWQMFSLTWYKLFQSPRCSGSTACIVRRRTQIVFWCILYPLFHWDHDTNPWIYDNMYICIYIYLYVYIHHMYRLRYGWCILYARVSKKCNHANIIRCNFNEEYEHQSWVGIGCASPEVSLLLLGSCADTEKSLQSHVKEKHSPNYKGFSNIESLQTPWHSYPGCNIRILQLSHSCAPANCNPHTDTQFGTKTFSFTACCFKILGASNLIEGLLKSTKKYP